MVTPVFTAAGPPACRCSRGRPPSTGAQNGCLAPPRLVCVFGCRADGQRPPLAGARCRRRAHPGPDPRPGLRDARRSHWLSRWCYRCSGSARPHARVPRRPEHDHVDFPINVALAELVPTLPIGTNWRSEPKLDGHRTIMWREENTVRLQARSGRNVTPVWMDLALAGLNMLPPNTVLDGEAVIYMGAKIDFAAAQSRAASTPARARRLAKDLPAHFAAWDILVRPELGDVRARPYDTRRALLLDLLHEYDVQPPIQAVPMTDDPDVAMVWYQQLREQGVEGLIWKPATSAYRAGPDLEEDPSGRDRGGRRRRLHRVGHAAADTRGPPSRRTYRAHPGAEGAARRPGRSAPRDQHTGPNCTHWRGDLHHVRFRAGG